MSYAPLLLAFLSLSFSGVQAPEAGGPAAASLRTPITVQLITVCDFPDELSGQRVRIPTLGVKHILGARLLMVGKPRIFGIDRSYQETFRYDNLLVLLPAAASLARGQVITVTGEVRTVAAVRALGVRLEQESTDKKEQQNAEWRDTTPVVVADSVQTPDGVVLVGK